MSLEQLTLSDEQVQDIVASLITSGNNANAVYDDTNDTLTVSLSNSISVNTLEANRGVTVNNSGTDPSSNGEIRNNNGTIKIQTNGDIRELGQKGALATERRLIAHQTGAFY